MRTYLPVPAVQHTQPVRAPSFEKSMSLVRYWAFDPDPDPSQLGQVVFLTILDHILTTWNIPSYLWVMYVCIYIYSLQCEAPQL